MTCHDMKWPSNFCNSWSVQIKHCIICQPQSRSSNSQPSPHSWCSKHVTISHLECIRRQFFAICNWKWSAKKIRSLRKRGWWIHSTEVMDKLKRGDDEWVAPLERTLQGKLLPNLLRFKSTILIIKPFHMVPLGTLFNLVFGHLMWRGC